MPRSCALLLSACIILQAVYPLSVFADVVLYLKNGMTMTAESCEESAGVLTCVKMGGTFDLNRAEVESMRETSGPLEDQLFRAERPADEAATNGQAGEAAPAGATAGAADAGARRMEQIRQRKTELQAERERLMKERQQLLGDVKNAPDWMATDRYEALSKRNAEIEERVKRFNEEIRMLDEEEKKIVGEARPPKKAE